MLVADCLLFLGCLVSPFELTPLYLFSGSLWFFLKIFVFLFIFSWVKATVPRFRYDQLMRLGWKIFLPLSLIWVFLVSGWLMLTKEPCPAPGMVITAENADRYMPSCSARTLTTIQGRDADRKSTRLNSSH